jgi:ABC-type Mn2+/Zn2+ transport system permease subunit
VSFEIEPGAVLGIVGPNGCGKTILLRTILGLQPALHGSVTHAAGLAISYVPQRERLDVILPLTALDVVLMGRTARAGALARVRPEDHVGARRALAQLGIEAMAAQSYRSLSGGQQQRVIAAVVLGALPSLKRVPSESIMGWAFAAASAATVLVLSRASSADADTMHLLYGNLLAVGNGHAFGLAGMAIVAVALYLTFMRRFLLATFDPEAAQVAGVNVRGWSLLLNLLVGAAAALAVHHIGALLTFALLTLPAMAALLVTTSVRAAFAVATVLGTALAFCGLAASFYFDLPAGPATVALLAASVPLAAAASRWR